MSSNAAKIEPEAKPVAFVLNDWEINGYDDSDFEYALWVPSEGKVIRYQYGSTRYASAGECPYELCREIPADVLEAARAYLEEGIYKQLCYAEEERMKGEVMFNRGDEVRMLDPVNFRDKKNIDPETGKPRTVKAQRGDVGTVIWEGFYGRFYANGYKQPDRSYQRIGVKFGDGRVVFCASEKAALVIDNPVPDSELRDQAHRLSYQHNYKPLVSSHGGWLTTNAALKAAESQEG